MIPNYPQPLDRLLLRGDAREPQEWPDYVAEYGLTEAQIPDLIRMATDDDLSWLQGDDPRVWGPVHARRALGQLRAAEAVQPLLEQLAENDTDEYEERDDWISSEVPRALAMIGAVAFDAVAAFVRDLEEGTEARSDAAEGLVMIAKNEPSLRDPAVRTLIESLEIAEDADPALNGFLVCSLVDLQAVEAIPQLREIYQKGYVDPSIFGDFQDVEVALGVRSARSATHRGPDLMERIRSGLTGMAAPTPEWARVGRNELCPCGSGFKFKKCCLAKVPKA